MSCFVQGDGTLLLCGEYFGFLLQSADDAVYGCKEILFAYSLLVMAGSDEGCFVANIGNVGARETGSLTGEEIDVYRLIQLQGFEVHAEHLFALIEVGKVYMYLAVKASSAQQGFVKNIYAVGSCQDDDTRVGAESVHLCEQLVEGVFTLIVTSHSRIFPASTTNSVNLVNEDDTGGLLFGLAEEVAYARCSYTDEHLYEIRA